jgi:hypothetical protein
MYSLFLHFCKRLFSGLESMTSNKVLVKLQTSSLRKTFTITFFIRTPINCFQTITYKLKYKGKVFFSQKHKRTALHCIKKVKTRGKSPITTHTHLGTKLHSRLLTNRHIDHTPHLASWEGEYRGKVRLVCQTPMYRVSE